MTHKDERNPVSVEKGLQTVWFSWEPNRLARKKGKGICQMLEALAMYSMFYVHLLRAARISKTSIDIPGLWGHNSRFSGHSKFQQGIPVSAGWKCSTDFHGLFEHIINHC